MCDGVCVMVCVCRVQYGLQDSSEQVEGSPFPKVQHVKNCLGNIPGGPDQLLNQLP